MTKWVQGRIFLVKMLENKPSWPSMRPDGPYKGVFIVTTANAILPVDRDHSVNTDSRISTVPRGSERAREWSD